MLVTLIIRPPALLQHRADYGLDQQEWPGEVGVDHVVPIGAFHAHDQLVAGHARIVHQNVDLAEARDYGLHSRLDLLFAADVHLERRCLAAFAVDLAGKLLQFLLIARAQRDLGSRLGEYQGARATDPLRRSSYQRNSAFHSRHEASCLKVKLDYKHREAKHPLGEGLTNIRRVSNR